MAGEALVRAGLHLHRYGHGEVLGVALHGWAGTHRTFEAVCEHLPQGRALLGMDMPGYGQSPDPAAWSAAALVAQMLAGLEGRLPKPCTLIGNCSGAVMALLLYEARPAWFDRVVLIEPFAFTPWYFRIFTLPALGRFFYWNAFENGLGRSITDRAMRDQEAKGTDLLEGFRQTRAATALGHMRVMERLREPARFRATGQVPVTMLWGSRTMPAVVRSVQIWQQLWPDAVAHEIPQAGHLLLQERPAIAAPLIFG